MRKLFALARDRDGSAAVQYAIVSGLAAVLITGAIVTVGPVVKAEYRKIADALTDTRQKLGLEPAANGQAITGTVSRERK